MENRLKNKKILITRERSQAVKFAEQIEHNKGVPIIAPLLKIDTYYDEENDTLLNSINEFDWIFFTSINGVNHFFKQLKEQQLIKKCNIAVVGHKTEEALNKFGISADFIPSTYNAETMAAEFLQTFPHIGKVLLVRGNLSRPTLLEEFTKAKINYSKIVVYETNANKSIKQKLLKSIDDGVDFLTFTSPSTVQTFIELVNEQQFKIAQNLPCFCIGTTTEQAAHRYQFNQTYVPNMFTIESMIEKMVEVVQMEGS